jgi:hypothetical protein
MSLGQILREGANATVARSISQGATEGETLETLRQKWPGESDATYDAAYARGLRAYQAAGIFSLADPDFPLRRDQIPASGGLPHGYRFYLSVSVYDPETGRTIGTSLTKVYRSIPSFSQLEQDITDQIENSGVPFETQTDPLKEVQNPVLLEYEIIAIELTT